MKKTIIAVAALGLLASSLPAVAQKAPVAMPKGVFLNVQPADTYLARDTVLFAKVRDDAGKIIGDVEDLIINANNEVIGAILGTGGFLGAGEKRIAVHLSALVVVQEGDAVTVTLPGATKELLSSLPEFVRNKPAKSLLQRVKEKAQELTDKSLETSKDAAVVAREQAAPALEKAKEAVGQALDKTKEAVGQAYDKAKDAAAPKPKE